ncbi:unnamed protein product [Spirodela intermedia]|uniref:RING-type E3 ubiquitin transferase n=1 Tax=Spirodela intermedia TaxID=51605 RepID=A0A7I8KSG1_SPIIN|nr:unnamed protein product [Spirodela intermedia]
MGPAPSAPYFWVVLWLSSLCLGACFYHNFQEAQGLGHHTYSRFSEVQRECNSILSSLSVVKLDHDIPSEMNLYGEWAQDSNDAPLMPLYMGPHDNSSGSPRPQFRASFSAVVDVDGKGRSQTAMNMSGTLTLSILKDKTWRWRNKGTKDGFLMFEGYSRLQIAFEGVYSESEADGERVMCLLGSAELPSRGYDPADPWKLRNGSDRRVDPIPLLKDEKIVLVVRRPKSFSLTRREIKGEMRSLHDKSTPGYFGKMQIAFQPERYPMTTYKFASEDITAKDCSPYARPNKWLGDHINIYKGPNFCKILHQLAYYQVFTMLPNGRCDSTNDYCRKMWPFRSGNFNATHGSFDSVKLIMTELRCRAKAGPNGSNISARVATLLKEVLPLESHYEASESTSLSRPIVSSEGIWNSSSGQLCMVACAGADPSRCNLRICLYVPTSFSLTQRSTVFGSISSISKSGDPSNFSFSLGRPIHAYGRQLTMDLIYVLSYEYSKTKQAAEFLRRDEALGHGGGIKKALLTYPRMNERGNLCRDLGLSVSLFPVQRSGRFRVEYVRLRILTLGSKFCDSGFYQSSGNSSDDPAQAAASRLNISAQLEITKTPRNSSLMLSVEGLYSQLTGKMYLVGCRVAAVPRKTVSNITEWQHLDCEIKVEIQYPPTTLRWLITPTAKLSIESNRSKDNDPLYFGPVKLQTSAIMYTSQSKDILSERNVELFLRISTMSIVIACILSQLFYIKDASAAAPYVSHVMLGVQALGNGLSLITGPEALFTSQSQRSYASSSQYDLGSDGSFQVGEFLVKSLVLTAFLLTLRLWQKVWESRIRLPRRVPSDKRVLVVCLILHAVGFLVTLLINPNTHLHKPIRTDFNVSSPGPSQGIKDWGARLEQYAGLVQDFFLIPQVIGNIVWQIRCRPLRKAYYLGITLIKLLPHAYNYIRVPPMNIYFDQAYEFVDPDLGFYFRMGDVVVALVVGLLAVVVYLQQRCGSHGETKRMLWLGLGRLWSPASGGYDKVASMLSESELVAGAMEIETPAKVGTDAE